MLFPVPHNADRQLEGLSELLDERGQRVGRGYLEMTGYAGALKL